MHIVCYANPGFVHTRKLRQALRNACRAGYDKDKHPHYSSAMPPAPEADIQFDCPLCSGAFEASAELLGREVECPHCGQPVELPSVEELLPATEPEPINPRQSELVQPSATLETEPARQSPAERPEPAPRQPLTREERAAARKRFNLMLAVIGGLLLVVAFVMLAKID